MSTTTISTVVAVLGCLVMVLGLVSKRLERSAIPTTLLALLIGIAIGPKFLGIIELEKMGQKALILENAARLTLGIGLIGVALRIPKEFPRHNWRGLSMLISVSMLFMWLVSSALMYLFLNIDLWMAALLGAIIAATDPIAASPIVTGPVAEENLPERIRHTISFESGANDGLSYLFVFLPLLMMEESTDKALTKWLTDTILWDVIVATGFGLLIGYVAAKLLRFAEKKDFIQENWRLVYTVALALLAIGGGKLIQSDEVLIAFAAGVAFVQVVNADERGEEEKGQEAVDRFFSIPIFALFGTAIPWEGWLSLGWAAIFLPVTIFLLRRIPVLFMLRPLLPNIKTKNDALFLGWFGPVAVAAIYYGALAEHRLKEPFIWDVISLIVFASAVVHGMTSTPLTRLYGKNSEQKNHVKT